MWDERSSDQLSCPPLAERVIGRRRRQRPPTSPATSATAPGDWWPGPPRRGHGAPPSATLWSCRFLPCGRAGGPSTAGGAAAARGWRDGARGGRPPAAAVAAGAPLPAGVGRGRHLLALGARWVGRARPVACQHGPSVCVLSGVDFGVVVLAALSPACGSSVRFGWCCVSEERTLNCWSLFMARLFPFGRLSGTE